MSDLLAVSGARTALVVEVPEAEPVVGEWRARHDPSAAVGMPAHVTVLYPWLPADAVDDATTADLEGVLAAVPSFEVVFRELARFPRTLYLAPSPPDAFVALTSAVVARWPECPPYDGRYDEVVPHLTVADAVDVDALAHVVAGVAPRLPVRTRVAAVSLFARAADGQWQRVSVHPLPE